MPLGQPRASCQRGRDEPSHESELDCRGRVERAAGVQAVEPLEQLGPLLAFAGGELGFRLLVEQVRRVRVRDLLVNAFEHPFAQQLDAVGRGDRLVEFSRVDVERPERLAQPLGDALVFAFDVRVVLVPAQVAERLVVGGDDVSSGDGVVDVAAGEDEADQQQGEKQRTGVQGHARGAGDLQHGQRSRPVDRLYSHVFTVVEHEIRHSSASPGAGGHHKPLSGQGKGRPRQSTRRLIRLLE